MGRNSQPEDSLTFQISGYNIGEGQQTPETEGQDLRVPVTAIPPPLLQVGESSPILVEFHIAGADHNQSDSDFRRRIVQQARQTINSPEFIIKESSRNIYLKLIIIPYQDNLIKIKPLKVVVDADREPNEIVTWTPLNKMNGVIEKEAVIYASAETDVPNSNVR